MKNNEKGITLIALIITIIVMLILVGVTINVALNGGLFEKAKTAAAQTEQEALYEELVASAEYTNSGEINVLATYNAFKEGKDNVTPSTTLTGLTESNTKNIVFTVAGKTGNYTYTITTGKIIKGENPWFTRGLTAGYIQYDKKYVNNEIAANECYVLLNSDGSIEICIDGNNPPDIDKHTREEVDDAIDSFVLTINASSFAFDTSTYQYNSNNTLTWTFNGEDYLFTLL